MLMNVLKTHIAVITMRLAPTFKGITPALATLDTQAVDFLAQVSPSLFTTRVYIITFSCL